MSAKSAARPFKSEPRHPLTGKRIVIRARTQRELNSYLHRLDVIRMEQRLGIATASDVATSLRGLERKRVTLLEAADSYAGQARLAPKTRTFARNVVRDQGVIIRGRPVRGALYELAGERLEALTAPRVARHFRAMADTHAWSSVRANWNYLRAIVRHAAEQGWILHAPWGMWRPARPVHARPGKPRRDCCRTALERDALYRAACELGDARLAAVVAVGAHTGARKGELAGLRWGDVEFAHERAEGMAGCTVVVRRQGDGRPLKRGEARVIVCPDLEAPLKAWLGVVGVGRAGAPLFPNAAGDHVRSGEVVNVDKLRAAAARAGLGDPKRWSLHSLRDSFVTIEAQACGGDLRRLAERTGHRSIDSLLRYLQTFERAPRALPAALSAPRA